MTRLVRAAALLFAFPFLACSDRAAEVGRPNFLVLDIDTLRADHLGCYGYGRATSPRIDRLAAQSDRFEWAFAQAPYTPPSQSSILTGLYVARHGVRTKSDRLAESIETMAERLESGGYRTAAFVDGGFLAREFGLAQGFAEYDDEAGGFERIGPKAMRWLEGKDGRPFFLLLHTYDVHTPYAPVAPYRELFLDGLEPPTPGFEPNPEQMERARTSMWTAEPRPLPERDLRFAEALYDAEIRFVDDWVGRLLDRLAELDLERSTVVVLLSDHGEEFGEHGSVLHEKPYATVTRIPLLVRRPGQTEGAVRALPVQGVDLAPTVVELAGLAPLADRDGRSLVRQLEGGAPRALLAFGENPWVTPGQYLVDGARQLLYHPGTPRLELYDYRNDPLQRSDLAAREPERVAAMGRKLAERIAWLEQRKRSAGAAAIDADTERQLKALGYL